MIKCYIVPKAGGFEIVEVSTAVGVDHLIYAEQEGSQARTVTRKRFLDVDPTEVAQIRVKADLDYPWMIQALGPNQQVLAQAEIPGIPIFIRETGWPLISTQILANPRDKNGYFSPPGDPRKRVVYSSDREPAWLKKEEAEGFVREQRKAAEDCLREGLYRTLPALPPGLEINQA